MATGAWLVAEDIYECGCIVAGYKTDDGKSYASTDYCTTHGAAFKTRAALRLFVEVYPNLGKEYRVIDGVFREATIALAPAEPQSDDG